MFFGRDHDRSQAFAYKRAAEEVELAIQTLAGRTAGKLLADELRQISTVLRKEGKSGHAKNLRKLAGQVPALASGPAVVLASVVSRLRSLAVAAEHEAGERRSWSLRQVLGRVAAAWRGRWE